MARVKLSLVCLIENDASRAFQTVANSLNGDGSRVNRVQLTAALKVGHVCVYRDI